MRGCEVRHRSSLGQKVPLEIAVFMHVAVERKTISKIDQLIASVLEINLPAAAGESASAFKYFAAF